MDKKHYYLIGAAVLTFLYLKNKSKAGVVIPLNYPFNLGYNLYLGSVSVS